MSVSTVRTRQGLQALAHPLRVRILETLREPNSAAGVGRHLDLPRQKVNYHLKELAKAGLVESVGERRSGNFVETLYRAVADAFVVSPDVAWADPRRVEAMRSQHSVEQLVLLGERLQQDAVSLLDRAAFDGEIIASASVTSELHFPDEKSRATFIKEYLTALGDLVKKYGAAEGEAYRVLVAAYPHPERQQES